MTPKTTSEALEYPSLYERTGDIKDINTLLVPRAALHPPGGLEGGEARKAETRFMNLEADIRRVIGWEKPINDFEVVNELQEYIAGLADSAKPAGEPRFCRFHPNWTCYETQHLAVAPAPSQIHPVTKQPWGTTKPEPASELKGSFLQKWTQVIKQGAEPASEPSRGAGGVPGECTTCGAYVVGVAPTSPALQESKVTEAHLRAAAFAHLSVMLGSPADHREITSIEIEAMRAAVLALAGGKEVGE